MPLLGPADSLPHQPWRVLVAGTSGSGKTTLAARISSVLPVPQVEMDALFHGPDWTPRPSFEADVHRFSAQSGWVTEWQYDSMRAHLAGRADLLVWLDLRRDLVMRQVVRRTLRRRMRRQRLWNANIEPPLWTFFTDREHIVRWAWNTRHETSIRMGELLQQRPELTVVRLGDRHEVEQWLSGSLVRSLARPR